MVHFPPPKTLCPRPIVFTEPSSVPFPLLAGLSHTFLSPFLFFPPGLPFFFGNLKTNGDFGFSIRDLTPFSPCWSSQFPFSTFLSLPCRNCPRITHFFSRFVVQHPSPKFSLLPPKHALFFFFSSKSSRAMTLSLVLQRSLYAPS